MDQDRFDNLARSFATRRGALRGLVGGVIAAAMAGLGPRGAAAACLKAGRPCPNDGACCAGATCEGAGRCARRGEPTGNCRCTCTTGLKRCGGRCVDVRTDEKNCGGCGAADPRFLCSAEQTCREGVCVAGGACTPACGGKECGPDGCPGGSCGSCGTGERCDGGACVPDCTRNCAGKTCGNDGCGGSCGTCAGGLVCSDPGGGGVCRCAGDACGGGCCAADQRCVGNACWPDDEERAFVTLIANHRAANGRPALALQNQLGAAAELHSQDQAAHNFSSHTGSDGSTPDQRFTRAGYAYSWWAENIYWGGPTAAEAFGWWKNSAGHNANMLSTDVTQLGIGRARSDAGVWYWTTTFGRPS